MKQRLVEHIVRAVTERRGVVLAVAAVCCVLSLLGATFLLESDMTFKGMIGQGAPPVQAYHRIIRDFEVSGVITVALEPPPAVERNIAALRARADRLVFDALDGAARGRLAAVVRQSAETEMTTLGDRDHLLCLVDLVRLLPPQRRAAAVSGAARLNAEDRRFILAHLDDPDSQRAVYRKFQKLDRADLGRLAALSKGLAGPRRDALALAVLGRMSVYDKLDTLEQSGAADTPGLARARAKVEQLDQRISTELADFKTRALAFAARLKKVMAGNAAPTGLHQRPADLVRGVLYSEELS